MKYSHPPSVEVENLITNWNEKMSHPYPMFTWRASWEPKQMLDWTKPIQTRAWQPARLLGRIAGAMNPNIVAIMHAHGAETISQRSDDGLCYGHHHLSGNDIINIPPKLVTREGWVNVNPDSTGYDMLYHSKGDADYYQTQRIACVKVTYSFVEPAK